MKLINAFRHLSSKRAVHLRWLGILLTGLALFAAVLAVLLHTGDPLYVPCLLLLGAGVVPASLATLVTEIEPARRLSLGRILSGAVLGGVLGTVLAGQLEFATAHALGSLSPTTVGTIEESAKLLGAFLVVAVGRPRLRAVDGLVLGVAVGSGFAALETMGYAFVTLLGVRGHLDPVAQLLMTRAVGSLGGHAAWTGLACAAAFGVRGARSRMLGRLRFVGVFVGAITLHAAWDRSNGGSGYLVVGGISFALLMTVAWWLHAHPAPSRAPRAVARENQRSRAALTAS